MPITLARPTPQDAAALRDLVNAALSVDLPADPRMSVRQADAALRPDSDCDRVAWLARDGDEAVGLAVLCLFRHENAHFGKLDVTVRPDRRRRGLGRELHDVAVAAARERGRTGLQVWCLSGGPGGGFVAAMGGQVGADILRNVLRDPDPGLIAELATGSASRTDGYSLVRWVDHCPEPLVAAYGTALMGMNDAPEPNSWRPVQLSPERVRQREALSRAHGDRAYVLAARHDATGELAGVTEVHVLDGHRAEQGDTTVLSRHRGHGLGVWLKATMVVWIAVEHPRVTEYVTFNDLENTHMNAVNARLGYRREDVWKEWYLPLR